MKKVGINDITANQFMFMLIGTVIGTGILSLPNNMAKAAQQDGWISVIVAGWYPLFIVITGIYFAKKYPNEDILALSKKCLGKFIGSILGFLFTINFLVGVISVTSGFTNVSRVYIIDFLTPIKIIGIVMLIALYGTFKGLKLLGRVSELTFYFLIILLFIPLIALKYGSFLNVSPVFGTGYKTIIKGSKDAIYAYTGIEIIYFIYPYVTEKKDIANKALKSAISIIFLYAYLTFITIFYIGPDVIQKSFWSVMVINETVNLPFINSFRFIFMFLWSIVIFKTILNLYYSVSYGLSNAIFKFQIKKLCFILYPFLVYLTIKYGNEISRRNIINKINPYLTYFNLIYMSLLAIIVHFKKEKKNETA